MNTIDFSIDRWGVEDRRLKIDDEECTHHSPEGDQPDQSVRWQQAQTDNQSLFQSFQFILIDASVDDEQEDGGNLGSSRESIFDRRVFRLKLSGEVGCADILVMGWEGVSLETEGTDPKFTSNVDLAVIR